VHSFSQLIFKRVDRRPFLSTMQLSCKAQWKWRSGGRL